MRRHGHKPVAIKGKVVGIMTLKIFAERKNGYGETIDRKQIGVARFSNNDGEISHGVSYNKFLQLKRAADKAFPRRKSQYTRIVDELGRVCASCHGYSEGSVIYFDNEKERES